MGITQSLPALVPMDVAKELVWTGRVVEAEEAKDLGLVTHLADDPHAAAMELAEEIASKSPHAIRFGKKLLSDSYGATSRPRSSSRRRCSGSSSARRTRSPPSPRR